MKHKFYLLLTLFIFSFTNAQIREIPAVIINQNNDTIKTNILVAVNIFDKTLINELSIIKKIRFIDSIGNKNTIFAKEINKITFVDLKNKNRTFKFDGKNQLREIIYEGKIKVYYTYSANAYDGSIITKFDFYDENEEKVNVGPFNIFFKKALKKLVKENPELVKIIDESNLTYEETIILVLTKFETEYLNK